MNKKHNLIERNKYLDKIWLAKDKDLIKILTGVRRCGKSSLLLLLAKRLMNSGIPEDQILLINMEDNDLSSLEDQNLIYKYIKSRINPDVKTYILIDEVQEIPSWAKIINSLNVMFDVDIYITGSNSHLFSGEHLTYITGRYIEFEIYPLSFYEFIDFKKIDSSNNKEIFDDFITNSFPGLVNETDEFIKRMMLSALLKSAFRRDVILRGNIRNVALFDKVCRYVFDNVGKITSLKKIRDTIVSSGESISLDAITNYVNLLESAYLLYNCPKYDLKGKNILKTNGKFYSIDIGLAKVISMNNNQDSGFAFENFVYLELKKAGWDVYTLNVSRDYEIDFYAFKNGKSIYVQACISLENEQTRDREIRPFRSLNDNFDKFIVTLDPFPQKANECNIINVFEFIKVI